MGTTRPLTLNVEEAGRLLGVGRTTAYELARSGEMETIRLRRRLVVPVAWLAKTVGLEPSDIWALLSAETYDSWPVS